MAIKSLSLKDREGIVTKFMKQNFSLIYAVSVMIIFCCFFNSSAFAVESITLSPDSDIEFNNANDSKKLFVQVSPKQEGIELIIDISKFVANLSSETITTDADGKASFIVTPGSQTGMAFLSVSVEGIESNAIIVKNNVLDPEDPNNITTLNITQELVINWNENPNSRATITLTPAKIANLTIHNQNPEIVSVNTALSTDSSGTAGLNIIANKGGTAKIYVSMPDGTQSNVLTIKVYTDDYIIITPNITELKVGTSKEISAFGGSGTFFWSCKDGLFDKTTGDSVTWTAPNYPGVFNIVVADNKGKTGQIRAFVTEPLKIYPKEISITHDQKVEFHAIGGKPDYQFSVKNGGAITLEEVAGHSDFKIAAPSQTAGEYTVIVTDALGDSSEAKITVLDHMTLSRNEVEITQDPYNDNIELNFDLLEKVEINNGKPPFSISVEKGDFRLKGRTISIIPPINNDTYKVVVKDTLGDVQSVLIKTSIPGRLLVQPANPKASVGETLTFEALGGSAEYTFVSSAGTLLNQQGNKIDLLVDTDSDITLVVKDGKGSSVSAYIQVSPAISIDPSSSPVNLFPGQSKKFKVSGGNGVYRYSTNYGIQEELIEHTGQGEFVFTAPLHSGTITLTVTDTRNSSPASIKFNMEPIRLGITPSLKVLDLGAKGTEMDPIRFNIVTTNDNDLLEIWAEYGTITHKGKKIIYTPPTMKVDDIIHLRSIPEEGSDSIVQEAHAKIQIVQGLSITPSVLYLENKEGKTDKQFTVIGGAGGYTITAKYGTLSHVFAEPGDKITYSSPEISLIDENIVVTDKAGSKTSAIVRVSNSLKITPLMQTVGLGEQCEFSVLNGVPPYTPTANSGTLIENGKGKYLYTAPGQSGEYKINVFDAANNQISATIFVTNSLKITPQIAVLSPGESTEIRPITGTPPYQFTATIGNLSSTSSSGESVIYTAPVNFEGDQIEAYVKVYDSEDITVATEIKIISTPKPFISTNSNVLMQNELDKFMVNLSFYGQGQADVYAALQYPDGTLLFFDSNKQLVTDFVAYGQNKEISDTTNQGNIFSGSQMPSAVKGQFILYSVLVQPGQDLLDLSKWISELGMHSFEIK